MGLFGDPKQVVSLKIVLHKHSYSNIENSQEVLANPRLVKNTGSTPWEAGGTPASPFFSFMSCFSFCLNKEFVVVL